MNRHLHSTNAARCGATLGLSLLRAACGFTLLGMLLLPEPAHAAVRALDGSSSGHVPASGQGDGDPESLDHGTGLSTTPGNAPFGDDTIGTLPIHCDDDAVAMDEIMASLAPVFFIEGSSADILNLVLGAVEVPGALDPAAVYAIPSSSPGQWRVYFMGEIDLTLDRGQVSDSKHRVKFGLFGTQGFGRGRIAYGGPGSGWSRPSAFFALTDHRIPLAELERNGLLVGSPTKVMTLSRSRRSSTVLQDTGAGLVVSLRP